MDMALPPLVIFGPSGVGKGTLITRLMRDFPNAFGFSVSRTEDFLTHDLTYHILTHTSKRYYTCPTSRREGWERISLHHTREL